MGPTNYAKEHLDTLTTIARVMSDEQFRYDASVAQNDEEMLTALDDFVLRTSLPTEEKPALTPKGLQSSAGEFVIPPRFPYPANFSDGLAGVPIKEKGWGFIDKEGNTVIEPRFNWIYGGFRHGVAEVLVDGKVGYINKSGEWVWEPTE